MISIKELLEIVMVVCTIKLITKRYRPPIQQSLQAIICIVIGTGIALMIDKTTNGLVTGIIGSGLAFYGGDLLEEFRTTKNEIQKETKEIEDDR